MKGFVEVYLKPSNFESKIFKIRIFINSYIYAELFVCLNAYISSSGVSILKILYVWMIHLFRKAIYDIML